MASMRWCLSAAVVLTGCSLARAPIVEQDVVALDGGPDAMLDAGMDAPELDAPLPDVPGLDAPLPDVPGLDAPLPVDAPTDTALRLDAPLDAPLDVPRDTPPDVPTDARCSTGPDRDGDGVVDACDPCPDDNPDDSDGDGVCNSLDLCPGQNDRADADGDSIPDGCDDWPCGPRPMVTFPVVDGETTITGLSLDAGGATAVATGGATVNAAVSYDIRDCGCPGCLDQIEVGLVPGRRAFCAYDGNPPACPSSSTGSRTRGITVPMASGLYEVRFQRAQDFSCNEGGRTDWWIAAPGPMNRIGVICVR